MIGTIQRRLEIGFVIQLHSLSIFIRR